MALYFWLGLVDVVIALFVELFGEPMAFVLYLTGLYSLVFVAWIVGAACAAYLSWRRVQRASLRALSVLAMAHVLFFVMGHGIPVPPADRIGQGFTWPQTLQGLLGVGWIATALAMVVQAHIVGRDLRKEARRGVSLVALLLAGAVAAAEAPAARREPAPADRLQAFLDSLVAETPGVRSGLLLVDGPDLHWSGASGVAFADSGLAALPGDQFNIDSMAKPMTACIAMKLVEEGRLALDDRIAGHLPDSLIRGLHVYEGRSYGGEITVRQLLNHTSGIVDSWACPGFLDSVAGNPERRWTPEETIGYVRRNCAPRFKPGGGFHYSDTGYNLLGLVLQKVAGKPLHVLYREMLLDPLGMQHTYRPAYEPPRPSIPGRRPAERYLGDIECGLWTSVMTADWAGGGLLSTTEDLALFLRAFAGNRIFRNPSTKDTMLTWVESGPINNYGLGVSRVLFERMDDPATAGLREVWGHSGSSHNFMYYWPREDLVVVGTLNQMAVEARLVDTVATLMRTIRAAP